MTDAQEFMDAEVKNYVVKAAAQRMNKFMKKPPIHMMEYPTVKAYLKGTQEGISTLRMMQRLLDQGSITSPYDVNENTFLGMRLLEEFEVDWDECRRVLAMAFIGEELERLVSDGKVGRITSDDGVTKFRILEKGK